LQKQQQSRYSTTVKGATAITEVARLRTSVNQGKKREDEEAAKQLLSQSLTTAKGATAVTKAAGLGAAGAQGKKNTAICTTATTAATRLR
jgi:hypothetical protein